MINLFRKIRKQLADDNKPLKYMRYAIGEIVLVVVGILIALSINNWNELKKNNKIEFETLQSLKEDLISSRNQLIEKIEGVQERVLFDSLVLLHINERQLGIDMDSLNFLVTNYFTPPTFDPEEGILIEIISSGKLNIIQSQKIRSFVSSWNMNTKEIKELEQALLNQYIHHKEPFFYNHFSYRNSSRLNISKTNLTWGLNEILSDIKFENIMVKSLAIHRNLLRRQLGFKERMDSIIQLIEKEIKK